VTSLATAGSSSLGWPEPAGTQPASLTLSLAEMKTLCVVVAAGMGLVVAEIRPYRSHTDVFLDCTVLLHPRRVLIRLVVDQVTPTSVQDTAEEARRRDCADYLIITTQPLPPRSLIVSDHVMGPDDFVSLLRSSHAIAWVKGRPQPRRDDYIAARRRAARLQELDHVGLGWLPQLSRFKLPWQLRASTTPADEWFERIVFQLATTTFRLGGVRLGTAKRGQRVGDALLWRGDEVVLLDCKAAQDGYRLDVDDERRLLEYAQQLYPEYGITRRPRCVVLISSAFPIFNSQPHRFAERRQRFVDVGSNLACICADDLVDAGLELLKHVGDTRTVDNIPWCRVLDEGMVTRQSLISHCTVRSGGP
jgi:hypothetical protein